MKRNLMIATLILAILALVASVSPAQAKASTPFKAKLSGAQEVPARVTKAAGVASLHWNGAGTAFNFTLTVRNISNVFAAHIHCGAAGVNGPVGVTLFMGMPASGRFHGALAYGTVSAPDPGNACGWVTMQDVFNAMSSGDTYINVHTNDGVAPPNSGPGDFQSGEIRGQLQ